MPHLLPAARGGRSARHGTQRAHTHVVQRLVLRAGLQCAFINEHVSKGRRELPPVKRRPALLHRKAREEVAECIGRLGIQNARLLQNALNESATVHPRRPRGGKC